MSTNFWSRELRYHVHVAPCFVKIFPSREEFDAGAQ